MQTEYAPSKCIIQKLVTPKIAFQSPNVETEGVGQTIQPCQFNGESDFIPSISGRIAVDGHCRGFHNESIVWGIVVERQGGLGGRSNTRNLR